MFRNRHETRQWDEKHLSRTDTKEALSAESIVNSSGYALLESLSLNAPFLLGHVSV